MNKIITQKSTAYPAYIGILLLYLKLFLIEPLFNFAGTDISAALILLLFVFLRVVFKLTFKSIDVFGNNAWAKRFWIFILFTTLSSFFLSPNIASGVLTVNFQIFLVYLIFIDFKSIKIDPTGLKKIINALNYFAILNTLLVYYTFFIGKIGLLGEVTSNTNVTRAFGLMGDQLPWFLSFFALYALYNRKNYLFLFFTSGILMGASLGATIVLVVSCIFFLLKEKRISRALTMRLGFLAVVILILMLSMPSVFSKISLFERINEGDFSSKDARTTGHRFGAITHAIDNIAEKPFLGYQNYSLTMFQKYDSQLLENEKDNLTFLTTPNNQLLATIADNGIIGFFLFVCFIYSIVKITNRNNINIPPLYLDNFKKAGYLWLIVYIFFNQSATWFLPGSFLWVLICLIIAICYKINKIYGIK